MAKAVNGVLTEQALRLGKLLGARGGPQAGRPAEPARQTADRDFVREMEAGVGEANSDAPGSRVPVTGLPPTPPEKAVNDQGFVGR
ncbi:MAG: hypothetical protein FJX31_08300 [Alphaproteobacteria bacterium]|nr:hypothetical protein [Alphaproteobacteria bacterium]